ncbi:MAG: hypothetical protein LQ349_007017, partial [Xanthoria aureola]
MLKTTSMIQDDFFSQLNDPRGTIVTSPSLDPGLRINFQGKEIFQNIPIPTMGRVLVGSLRNLRKFHANESQNATTKPGMDNEVTDHEAFTV